MRCCVCAAVARGRVCDAARVRVCECETVFLAMGRRTEDLPLQPIIGFLAKRCPVGVGFSVKFSPLCLYG